MEFSGNAIWLIGQRKIAILKEYTIKHHNPTKY